MYKLLILVLFKFTSCDCSVANTNSGPVQGIPSLHKSVEAFLGIPYAQPPIGELRFAKPVPVKRWYDVYKANKLPPPCIQSSVVSYYFMPDVTDMSEDCLYLNVWAPRFQEESVEKLRPVIIFIHAGSFVSGATNQKVYDGSNMASRGDVIIVTINYRLGALGYFLAYTEEAQGNMAMYDQVLAVKWVKENAKLFGGDPENIVLMGSSAGAYSVSAHLVSPISQGLFKKAIIESGTLLNPLFADNDKLHENSQVIASLMGCTNKTTSLKSDPHSVMRCLKNAPAEAFAEAEASMLSANAVLFYPRTHDQFLPNSFVDLVREGNFRNDVDVLIGVTDEEGAVMMIVGLRDYLGDYGENIDKMNKHRAVAFGTGAVLLSRQSKPSTVMDFYLRQVKDRTAIGYTKMLANMIGDFSITCNAVFFSDFLSLKANSVYFYKFGFQSVSTPMADWMGPTHLDELQYVFGNPYHKNFTDEELELSHRLIDRWSSFAKTGNPNIEGRMPWPRYSYNNPLYFHFGQEEESIRSKPNARCEFWRTYFNAEINPELSLLLTNSGCYPVAHSLSSFRIISFVIFTYFFRNFQRIIAV